MQYKIVLQRIDDDETHLVLKGRHITADQAIGALLWIEELTDFSQEEAITIFEEKPEPEPEPAPKKKTHKKPADAAEPIERLTKKKQRGCGVCGQPGHNAKTCNQGYPEVKKGKPVASLVEEEEDSELAKSFAMQELEHMIANEPKLSVSELELMFPSIPLYQIVAARERILKTI